VLVGDVLIEVARIVRAAATLQLIDTLADFDLDSAVWSVRAALDALHENLGEGQRAATAARAAFAALIGASGSTLHLDTSTDLVTLRTADQTAAGLLAARLSHSSYTVRMRLVERWYQVE